ncbi:MAG: DNA polymerase III subunit delta' [Rickettsiales bacterium]
MAREKIPSVELPAPRANPHLFGHAGVEQRFVDEFSRGTTHHAYLITGPRGIGKATLAYRMARFALGQGVAAPAEAPSLSLFGNAPEVPSPAAASLQMDPESQLFRRVASGAHSDLRTLEPGDETKKPIISVEAARKIPEFLSLTPAEGAWRVVVIDAADQLNANAANALLKTIEEPPPRALLLLVSHEPGKLLPTIRSRCRHYPLQPPDTDAFAATLQQLAPSIAPNDYAPLYALSYGSPGYAMTLHQANGIDWYLRWLAAMQPTATHEARQSFADSASAQKSVEGWDAVLHGWRVAMHRLMLHPHPQLAISPREAALIAAIMATTTPRAVAEWRDKGNTLLQQTDTFNLDKRLSIRLLTDPSQLDRLAA